MNGAIYERELAQILSGDSRKVLNIFRRRGIGSATAQRFCEKPFFVTRSAGSQGADIIAVRDDISLIIEVKSSGRNSIVFSESSGKRQEQAKRLNEICERSGLFLIYAYRLKGAKGDPWRLFCMKSDPKGRMRFIYNLFPKVSESRNGNFNLKWEEGFQLTDFLEYAATTK
ncbi:MAG: hypothetical protein AAE977_00545 [Thermoplasmataceae archaeon]